MSQYTCSWLSRSQSFFLLTQLVLHIHSQWNQYISGKHLTSTQQRQIRYNDQNFDKTAICFVRHLIWNNVLMKFQYAYHMKTSVNWSWNWSLVSVRYANSSRFDRFGQMQKWFILRNDHCAMDSVVPMWCMKMWWVEILNVVLSRGQPGRPYGHQR